MACSLASYGDDLRAEPVMRFSYDLWKNRVLPVWRQVMGKNGGWHEHSDCYRSDAELLFYLSGVDEIR